MQMKSRNRAAQFVTFYNQRLQEEAVGFSWGENVLFYRASPYR